MKVLLLVAVAVAAVSALAGPVCAVPPPAAAFATAPVIRTVAMSADGQHLAIAGRADGQAVIRFATVDQPSVTLAKLGDVSVDRLRWIGEDKVYAEVEFPTKFYRGYVTLHRVVVVDAKDGHAVTMLADNQTSNRVLNHAVSGVSADNHLLMFGYPPTLATTKAYPALLRIDPATGVGEPIQQGSDFTGAWLIDKAGEVRGQIRREKNGDFSVQAGAGQGAALKEVWRTAGEEDRRRFHGYSAADNAILVAENGPQGEQLVLKHLAGGEDTPIGKPHKTKAVQYVWEAHGGRLVGRGFGGDRPDMEWAQPDLGAVQASLQKLFKGAEVFLDDWSSDRTRFVITVASPDTPTVWYLFDKTRHELSPLGEMHPDLKGVQLGETRWITYRARDGLEIGAYVTRPPGMAPGSKRPLIILPHPELGSLDSYDFNFMAQFLATRGYVVLRPQYRGSFGFGEAFERAGDWEWGAKMQTDLLDGVAALAGNGDVDASRVCIVGEDFAGYLALAGATLYPKSYACAVSVSGASDLTGVLAGWGGGPFAAVRTALKTSPRDARIAAMSPRAHVADVQAPILLMWKGEDAVMAPEQSQAMADALAHAHKPFETIVLTDTDHAARIGSGALQLYQALGAFLAKNLPVQP
jgi:dipeptidyl aminopeptidase/acylaminoacyl peptidase